MSRRPSPRDVRAAIEALEARGLDTEGMTQADIVASARGEQPMFCQYEPGLLMSQQEAEYKRARLAAEEREFNERPDPYGRGVTEEAKDW